MNLTVQRELFRNYSVGASYVGALGRKLPASVDRNYPVFGPGATAANVNARRPYQPGVIGSARVLESTFNSDYHGLQLSAREARRALLGEGLLHLQQGAGGRRLPGRRPAGRAELEPSRAGARPHHVRPHARLRGLRRAGSSTTSRTAAALKKALLNDWTLSAIVTLQTGQPLTITSGLRPQPRRPHHRSRQRHRRSHARQRPPARGADRELVQHGRLRPAGARRRRHRRPQHRRGSRLSGTSTWASSATSASAATGCCSCARRRRTSFNFVNLTTPGSA